MNPTFLVLKKWYFSFSQRKTTREKFKLGVYSTYILMLFFIGFLWVYYVWMLNTNATKWYEIINLENQKNKLILEKELLKVRIADLESIQTISKWEWVKTMKKIENPWFIVLDTYKNYVFKY